MDGRAGPVATLVPELRRPRKGALALSYHTATFRDVEKVKLEVWSRRSASVATSHRGETWSARLRVRAPLGTRDVFRLRSEKPALNIGRKTFDVPTPRLRGRNAPLM